MLFSSKICFVYCSCRKHQLMPKLKIWNTTFQQHYRPLSYGASIHLNLSPFWNWWNLKFWNFVHFFKTMHVPVCVAGHGQGRDSTSVRGQSHAWKRSGKASSLFWTRQVLRLQVGKYQLSILEWAFTSALVFPLKKNLIRVFYLDLFLWDINRVFIKPWVS